MDKTHIEHPVSFVQYKIFNILQINEALIYQVQKPSGSCNKDIDTSSKGIRL